MIKKISLLIFVLAIANLSFGQGFKDALKKAEKKLNEVTGQSIPLSEEEVGEGLKEALNLGVGKAVDFLSAEDGYYKSIYKILLPEEAQAVTDKLKAVPGFADVEQNLIEKMNRAAEDAAEKAKPIFVSAIKQMTIRDAMDILLGEKDSATRYLEKTTYDPLYNEFRPIIIEALDKVNAREYWKSAVTAYNKIPFVKKTNPELDDHVTATALVGMFSLIQTKEEDIRGNQSSRTSDLLRKVFAEQDGK